MNPHTFSHFFVLRSPILPIEVIQSWGEGLSPTISPITDAGDDCWSASAHTARLRLQKLIGISTVQRAITFASPDLAASINHWLAMPESKRGIQTERALVRYLSRMSSRSTPFGLFSSCSVGFVDWSEERFIRPLLSSREHCEMYSRLDYEYGCNLCSFLESQSDIYRRLPLRRNASLYASVSSWHYIETTVSDGHTRHSLARVDRSEWLDRVLFEARVPVPFARLVSLLQEVDPDDPASDEDAEACISELISLNLLITNLAPAATGDSVLTGAIGKLQTAVPSNSLVGRLSNLEHAIAEYDQRGMSEDSSSSYEKVVASLPLEIARKNTAPILQTDLLRPLVNGVVGQPVLKAISSGMEVLSCLSRPQTPTELVLFRRAFVNRYGHTLVPLSSALDIETGIGFGGISPSLYTPLLKGLTFSRGEGKGTRSPDLILKNLVKGDQLRQREANLSVDDFEPEARDPAWTDRVCDIQATIFGESFHDGSPSRPTVWVRGGSGPSGIRMLGRFGHTSPALKDLLQEYARNEQASYSDAILAEIVYQPEGRLGNVLARPVLRDFEIICLGRSGAPLDRQITIEDLLVGVQADRVCLFSRSLRRQIIPRLSNAHSFMNHRLPPLYRFLCYLQVQSGGGIPEFSWGALGGRPHLPRVKAGESILSLEEWNWDHDDLGQTITSNRGESAKCIVAMQVKLGMPRYVTYHGVDGHLLVDFNNPLSVDALVPLFKRSSSARFTESFPGVPACMGPDGHYLHEMIIPTYGSLYTKEEIPQAERLVVEFERSASISIQRQFSPGSEWAQINIYVNEGTSDNALISHCAPALTSLKEEEEVDLVFFLRYYDPEPHIRLRFHSAKNDSAFWGSRIVPFLRSLNDSHLRFTLNTYEREVERYGGQDAIQLAERIFDADSVCALHIIENSLDEIGLQNRWKYALTSVTQLLADYGLSVEQTVALYDELRTSFGREIYGSSKATTQLDMRYRKMRTEISDLISGKSSIPAIVHDAFGARSRSIRAILGDSSAELIRSATSPDVVKSIVHMAINRLITASQREHESVIYHFLYRYYSSAAARTRHFLHESCASC